MNEKYPTRKNHRLKNFDYGEAYAYFITICTKDKKEILSEIKYSADSFSADVRLSEYGRIVEKHINGIVEHYPGVEKIKYVIMPNHLHLLIDISERNETSVLQMIKAFKRSVTAETGVSIWQNMSYDKVIDSDKAYENIWQYIEDNPIKWLIGKGNDY